MDAGGQKSVVLILARELASNLAMPMFLVDRRGRLVFYNEAAEDILGAPWSSMGELETDEWATRWSPEDLSGNPLDLEDLPLAATMISRTANHNRFRITGLDGVKRTLSATAIPLFRREGELDGAVGIFWQEEAGS